MIEQEPETTTIRVFSPIATRTRRSSSLSNTASPEVPLKKRRSSIKRKSLAEALQCVEGSTPVALISRNSNESGSSSKADSKGKDTSAVDGIHTIYTRYAELEDEAKQWKKLLQKYKDKDAHAKEEAQKFLRKNSKMDPMPKVGTLDYEEIAKRIESYEQRITKAVKCISRAAEAVVDVQEKLDIRDKKLSDKIHVSPANECDPRNVLEGIFSINNDMLSDEDDFPQSSEVS